MAARARGSIYTELLGAKPVINAGGNLTFLGGSTPSPEVQRIMAEANSSFIPQDELAEAAGQHVAELLSAPAAMVTTGCASGLTLAAAAAMAGDSPTFIQQLPNTMGMKNEVVIQSNQRYHYDRALEFSGAKLVEYGGSSGAMATAAQLEAAISPATAAIVYVAGGSRNGGASYIDKGPVMDFDEIVAVATKHGIPVIVDAAVEVFPLSHMCVRSFGYLHGETADTR